MSANNCDSCFHDSNGECYMHEAERLRMETKMKMVKRKHPIDWNIISVVGVSEFIRKYGYSGAGDLMESYFLASSTTEQSKIAVQLGMMMADLESALSNYKKG